MAVEVLAAPLPDLDLPPGWTITVASSDANTRITLLNAYGYTPEREQPIVDEPVPAVLGYVPQEPPG